MIFIYPFSQIKVNQINRHLKSITLLDAEVTSLSFNNDGFTIVPSATNGKIYVYDLRNTSAAKLLLARHDYKAINSLDFSKKIFNEQRN